jgi:hypothetical protein
LYYINRYYTRDLEPEFITEDLQWDYIRMKKEE